MRLRRRFLRARCEDDWALGAEVCWSSPVALIRARSPFSPHSSPAGIGLVGTDPQCGRKVYRVVRTQRSMSAGGEHIPASYVNQTYRIEHCCDRIDGDERRMPARGTMQLGVQKPGRR